jgi:hypothetical protein
MNSPLEVTRGWYDLPAVAEAAPMEFLRAAWGWLVTICEKYHSGGSSTVLYLYGGSCVSLDERPSRPEAPILSAFCVAIDAAATAEPDQVVGITKQSWLSESAVVHRLLVRGLCLIVRKSPQIGIEYLRGDRRRFEVGDFNSYGQSDSIQLIRELAPRLSTDERMQLEQLIISWSRYRDDVELSEEQNEWSREFRLRLLVAIPPNLMSASTTKLVEREKVALPGWDDQRVRGRSGWVQEIPPLSKEEMLSATNEQVLKAITSSKPHRSQRRRIEVEGGWQELGGAEAAARELADLAKDHPLRVVELVEMIVSTGNEEIAAHAIHGLAESILTDEEVFGFVRRVAALNPTSEELRSELSYLLYRRCRDHVGLPDDLCETLRNWLSMPWDSTFGNFTPSNSKNKKNEPERVASILWSHDSGLLDTDRSFWSLLAITHGYLARSLPDTQAWLEVILAHLDRDVAERTWAAYCSEFRGIRLAGCDRTSGTATIAKLFKRFPGLRQWREGILLIANTSDLLSAAFLQDFLNTLRGSIASTTRQAFGELLTLIAFRDKNHSWAMDMLNRELVPNDAAQFDESIAVGFTFAAAQLWDEPQMKAEASRVLCQLIPRATDRIGEAMGSVFWAREDFADDDATESLLRAFSQYPQSVSKIVVLDLVEHLAALLPHKRDVALAVCNAILKSGRREQDLFEAGPHLVKIAMTLQRFPDTRAQGLTLLEDLLRLGLDDAFRVLRDIDLRPDTIAAREPRKRRRRRSP